MTTPPRILHLPLDLNYPERIRNKDDKDKYLPVCVCVSVFS